MAGDTACIPFRSPLLKGAGIEAIELRTHHRLEVVVTYPTFCRFRPLLRELVISGMPVLPRELLGDFAPLTKMADVLQFESLPAWH